MIFFAPAPSAAIYTLSLHDALPISLLERPKLEEDGRRHDAVRRGHRVAGGVEPPGGLDAPHRGAAHPRSEEHTSELQSRRDLVCRLLLEKKKQTTTSLKQS